MEDKHESLAVKVIQTCQMAYVSSVLRGAVEDVHTEADEAIDHNDGDLSAAALDLFEQVNELRLSAMAEDAAVLETGVIKAAAIWRLVVLMDAMEQADEEVSH